MAWIRPYGHSGGLYWVDPAKSYDVDSAPPITDAYVEIEALASCNALFLNSAVANAVAIKVFADFTSESNYTGYLSYADDNGWHNAGTFQVYNDWAEFSISPTGVVTAISIYATNDEYDNPYIFVLFDVLINGDVPPSGTNMKINIGDVFKDVDSLKINVGDVWKNVVSASINIGDAWKTVF